MTETADFLNEMRRTMQTQNDEIQRLRDALSEAIEEMEDMIDYVPDYFRQKWEYDVSIATAKAHLACGVHNERNTRSVQMIDGSLAQVSDPTSGTPDPAAPPAPGVRRIDGEA